MILRRVHVANLRPGEIELDQDSAHHVRRVLRLGVGSELELFDDGGAVASATIAQVEPRVLVRVTQISATADNVTGITVASAIPKGERADWMIEKLSELGCTRFIPLATARSVVLPEGRNKRERWLRIATEAAKQSRRRGVMRVDELTKLTDVIDAMQGGDAFVLSMDSDARSIVEELQHLDGTRPASGAAKSTKGAGLTLFIGPEGGWSDEELQAFARSNIRGVKLTDTVLRVETAAITAAACAAVLLASNLKSQI